MTDFSLSYVISSSDIIILKIGLFQQRVKIFNFFLKKYLHIKKTCFIFASRKQIKQNGRVFKRLFNMGMCGIPPL